MIVSRLGSGWQTIIADLALILFMISIATDSAAPTDRPAAASASLMSAEPTAIYRDGSHAPPLEAWLLDQPQDPRQRLSVIATFTSGHEDAAAHAALALAIEARAAGRSPRVVIEPSAHDDLVAVLAFDDPHAGWHDPCSGPAKGRFSPSRRRGIACE